MTFSNLFKPKWGILILLLILYFIVSAFVIISWGAYFISQGPPKTGGIIFPIMGLSFLIVFLVLVIYTLISLIVLIILKLKRGKTYE